MAVVVKYVVVRNGEEKMTFTSKKEADAYDRLLDIADAMSSYLNESELGLGDDLCDAVGHYLAMNKDTVVQLLKSGKLPSAPESKK
ncbi:MULTISPECIES: YebG family protein [Corallincola]|uniref:Damage-inducible protein YebG n=3 Tax=Corallincola TaxID=1775176 RepID=A0A368NS14_9GAMM|nr:MULTISPECIES: YebG family protein [Corallincola]RCU52615.1 damage-inducible protein YebG [Corallincola holothuriorum]TAA48193.1 damage-inducible protein YebG [Corallincola spongiicola]TCI02512.1 damage-inducible protein YebG [Corallincola luteus]